MKRSSAGFSLIELMVTVGIFGVMSAGVVSLIVTMNQQIQKATSKNNLVALAQEVRNELAVPAKCTAALQGVKVELSKPTAIRFTLAVNNETIEKDAVLRKRGLRVTKFVIGTPAITGTAPGGNRLAIANVLVGGSDINTAEKTGSTDFQDFNDISAAPLNVVLDSSDKLVECRATGGADADAFCQSMGGTMNAGTQRCDLPVNGEKTCQAMGATWDGSKCQLPPDGAASCQAMGGNWNGSKCQFSNGNSDANCQSLGGNWDGSKCQFSPSGSDANCQSLGGTWSNNRCEFASSGDRTCQLLGGSWTNGKCQGLSGSNGQDGNNGASCPNSQINSYPNYGRPDPSQSTPHGQTVQWSEGGGGCTATTNKRYQCVSGVWIDQSVTYGSGDCNPSCFTSVTQVLMEDGTQKSIVDIRPGDRVVSGLSNTVNTVLGIEPHQLGERPLISLNGSDYFSTPEHPFLTLAGWKSINPQASAWEGFQVVGPLELGDIVKLRGEFVVLMSIRSAHPARSEMVYNLVLTGDHTYIANGYAVHNKL